MTLREEAEERKQQAEDDGKRRERLGQSIRNVAATADGKIVLAWLVGLGNLFADDFQPNAMAAYETGKKAIPRKLWKTLEEHAKRDDFIAICIGE